MGLAVVTQEIVRRLVHQGSRWPWSRAEVEVAFALATHPIHAVREVTLSDEAHAMLARMNVLRPRDVQADGCSS